MNKQFWFCGVFLLAVLTLKAQDAPPVSSENPGDAVANRSVPFAELLRKAEAGDNYAQYSVGNAYDTGSSVPRNAKEAVRWWLQAAEKGVRTSSESYGVRMQARIGSAAGLWTGPTMV
jgi:TPR repeat protein